MAEYEFTRTKNFGISRFLGRTDLRTSLSGPKFDEEADFDVRSAVDPRKPRQISEKRIFRSDLFAEKKILASKNFFSAKNSDQKFRFSRRRRGFGRPTAKRTSKSASTSNFALDRLILRSVRSNFTENMIFTAAKEGGRV